jgi:hypothetical protein
MPLIMDFEVGVEVPNDKLGIMKVPTTMHIRNISGQIRTLPGFSIH